MNDDLREAHFPVTQSVPANSQNHCSSKMKRRELWLESPGKVLWLSPSAKSVGNSITGQHLGDSGSLWVTELYCLKKIKIKAQTLSEKKKYVKSWMTGTFVIFTLFFSVFTIWLFPWDWRFLITGGTLTQIQFVLSFTFAPSSNKNWRTSNSKPTLFYLIYLLN